MTDEVSALPPRPELLDRRSVRIALFVVVPLALCALIASAIHVSMMGIDHTILVFGQRRLLAGAPTALRLTLMTDQGEMFSARRVEAALVCEGAQTPLSMRTAAPDEIFPAYAFSVPRGLSGACRVLIDLEFSGKRQRVTYPVDISAASAPENLVIPNDVPRNASPSAVLLGTSRIEVFTEDRGAPTGLSSVLFLRATTEGFAPSRTVLALRRSDEEEWSELRTDSLGLAAMVLRPFDMSAHLTVRGARRATADTPEVGTAPEEDRDTTGGRKVPDAQLQPLVVYSGISVAVHNPLLSAHEPLRLTAHQLSSYGPLVIDAFQDGRYVAGFNAEFRGGAADIAIRLPRPGLYRLQISSSVFSTDKAIAVRHAYVLAESESQNDALRHLLALLSSSEIDGQWAQRVAELPLEQGGDFDRQTLAAFALARLYRGAQPLERLLSSRKEDDANLLNFKSTFQRGVMIAILLLGLGVAALTSLFAIAALKRQRRITLMILADPSREDTPNDLWHTDHGAAEHRLRTALSATVLFAIVLGAFCSLAVLVFVLRWFQ